MDVTFLIVVLALVTIGAVLIFALVSKHRIEQRRASDAPKSSLAKDG